MRRYNAGVTLTRINTLLLAVLLAGLGTIACNRATESKEAVREGLMEHLTKNTGLDMKAMDVDVADVKFQGNQATAVVSFKPKSSPDAGMSMPYTLERRGAKWVVQKAGSGGGHGAGMPPATEGPAPGAAPGELPSGHPPVGGGAGAGAGAQGGAADLPPGHPPVAQPKQPATK
jgi:hypothetical protein